MSGIEFALYVGFQMYFKNEMTFNMFKLKQLSAVNL